MHKGLCHDEISFIHDKELYQVLQCKCSCFSALHVHCNIPVAVEKMIILAYRPARCTIINIMSHVSISTEQSVHAAFCKLKKLIYVMCDISKFLLALSICSLYIYACNVVTGVTTQHHPTLIHVYLTDILYINIQTVLNHPKGVEWLGHAH